MILGVDVLSEDNQINRKALGAIVFKDKVVFLCSSDHSCGRHVLIQAKLQQLCGIVWPEIARLADQSIRCHASEGEW